VDVRFLDRLAVQQPHGDANLYINDTHTSHFNPEDGGSIFLRNIDKLVYYTLHIQEDSTLHSYQHENLESQ
jgi:hypothetical protein